jgi:hypothetical protein
MGARPRRPVGPASTKWRRGSGAPRTAGEGHLPRAGVSQRAGLWGGGALAGVPPCGSLLPVWLLGGGHRQGRMLFAKPTIAGQRHSQVGAQFDLWSEYLEAPGDVEYMAFPRGAVFSEVVWSGGTRDYGEMTSRLARHLERLTALNVNFRPLEGPRPWQRGGTGRRRRFELPELPVEGAPALPAENGPAPGRPTDDAAGGPTAGGPSGAAP